MPTREEHDERFRHKKSLLAFLKRHEMHMEFSDWYVTVSFYAAVECVEAMFFVVKPKIRGRMGAVTTVEHCRGHRDRNLTLRSCFEDIFRVYTTLYGYNRVARYRRYVPVSGDGKSAESLLAEIESRCAGEIKNVEK